ncbi:MAG: SGNH/GDSL hydrolase family protein [Lachnospiraceae bacterium]|nr:SGNH/GDSL hydrolase family protein [Lachnospiraceae bacterium]
MQTIQILQKLLEMVHANAAVSGDIPWNDIASCMLMELDQRLFRYLPDEYESINNEVKTRIDKARSAGSSQDCIETLQYLMDLLASIPEEQLFSEADCEAYFYHKAKRDHISRQTVCVIGDSHVNFFSGHELLSFLSIGNDTNVAFEKIPFHPPFTVIHAGPCLAYQCDNPNSTTQFLSKLKHLMDDFMTPASTVIISLGEIDLRSRVFKHAAEGDDSYKEVVDEILSHYYRILLLLKEKGFHVGCWGPIASQPEFCPIDPMFPRCGSEQNRNRATAYFNDRLQEFCEKHDMLFMSIFYDLITPEYHTKSEYLSSDLCHLGQAARPLAEKEWQLLRRSHDEN